MTLAIIGAGPVGLALSLQASLLLPDTSITVFDARPLAASATAADPRALALSLGSIQSLERLQVWQRIAPHAMPIQAVHVSQQQPALLGRPFGADFEPALLLRAQDEGVPQLGAVASHSAIVGPLQNAWLSACEREPERLSSRFETRVEAIKPRDHGVEIDAGVVDTFDLAVVAEGGLFTEQARKTWSRSYGQTAWVGEVTLQAGTRGVAYERFTLQGPAALLPLTDAPGTLQRAALVWCVQSDDDPVPSLDAHQRCTVLNTLFPACAGRIASVSTLKPFPLGINAEHDVVQGRTVRIGNAAQTLHPVAGQGLNLGLRDAHALATGLARSQGDIDRALRQVQRHRRLDRWTTMATTDFLARSFTWQAPGLNLLRGLGWAALQKTRPATSQLARQMMFGTR